MQNKNAFQLKANHLLANRDEGCPQVKKFEQIGGDQDQGMLGDSLVNKFEEVQSHRTTPRDCQADRLIGSHDWKHYFPTNYAN